MLYQVSGKSTNVGHGGLLALINFSIRDCFRETWGLIEAVR